MNYDNLFGSAYIPLCSFAYIVLLAFVFFPRKKLNTVENTIYKYLIVINLVGIVLDVSSLFIAYLAPTSIFLIPIAKVYLLYLVAFLMTCTLYFFILAYADYSTEKKMEIYKKLKKWFLSAFFIVSTVILCLPLYFHTEDGVLYSYGAGALATYAVAGILFISWVVFLTRKRKTMPKSKMYPIIACGIVDVTSALLQFFIPELLVVTSACILATIILYLTVFLVENPDVRMMEEIKEARVEAEKANKSKTEFLSNMSHEIRTPLNTILGFSQSLLDENLENEAREDAEDIVNASESLLAIVNEILDISKIESNKLEIENSEYSFAKIYRYLVTMTEGRLGNKDLKFTHNCADNIPEVLYGDSVRIKQIAVNLLTNSVKYTQQGYVNLNIKCEIFNSERCKIIIEVEDSGIGIKDEDLKKLFSKFERLDTEKNINIEGTGLGLALTKRLVELMDGEINVESNYGQGSKFTVSFEQKIVNKDSNSATNEENKITKTYFIGTGQKVLVVDDNNVNLKVAKRLLEDYNLTVEFSNSGKDFIKKITSGNQYDLVLLDDMMPEMSGVETLKYLKDKAEYNIPTIALTANALAGMKEEYIKNGFTDYLSKPIEKEALEEILNNYLTNEKEINDSVEENNGSAEDVLEETENIEIVQADEEEEEEIEIL